MAELGDLKNRPTAEALGMERNATLKSATGLADQQGFKKGLLATVKGWFKKHNNVPPETSVQAQLREDQKLHNPYSDTGIILGKSRGQVDKTSAILGGVAAAGLAAATVSGLGDPGIRPNEQPTPIVRSSDVPRNPLIATDPTLQARATAEKQFEEANLNPSTPEPLPTTPDQAAAQKYELDNNKPTEYLQHEYRSPLDGEPTPQDRPDGQSSNPAATPTPDQQPKVMTYKEAKATGIAPENSGAVIDTSE